MFSYLTNAEPDYVISLYEQYLKDPDSVERSWRIFFDGLSFGADLGDENIGKAMVEQQNVPHEVYETYKKQYQVQKLVEAYRNRGHFKAIIDPLQKNTFQPIPSAKIDLKDFGLSEADLEMVFAIATAIGLEKPSSLKTIIEHLEKTYCYTVGYEYEHIGDPEIIKFFQERIEHKKEDLTIDIQRRILECLNQATIFESFLSTKYAGQKRFSLEGGEALIPMLDTIIETASNLSSSEIVIGMAHRGRLNVLANIMNKPYEYIFSEFEGFDKKFKGDGDVKYHLGFYGDRKCLSGKNIKLSLSPNPSHLETVCSLVEGVARARIHHKYKGDENSVVPILIHGDAAFAGQGIIMETLNFSQLAGYRVGGTVHLVINNQIGFTTNPFDSRSTAYCTDIAKMLNAPVFHINGDDPEAVYRISKLAMEFRHKFHKDIVIDLVCYRKYGHNEADEPRFTQPKMYQLIDEQPNPRKVYVDELISRGYLEAELAQQMEKKFVDELNRRLDITRSKEFKYQESLVGEEWLSYKAAEPVDFETLPETKVDQKVLETVLEQLTQIPAEFKPIRIIPKLFETRKTQFSTNTIDWGLGEAFAVGSLLLEGTHVRLSGQDCQRGTFGHRHAVIHDTETGKTYTQLNQLKTPAKWEVLNSPLSEYGVMGFEYGFTMVKPEVLTIWEAQFGDFVNGAQIIIDQFLTSSESKWGLCSGLVLLLPHGYEGQGPEHSSARVERFLQGCAEFNMRVCNASTPAQFFHLLRLQMKQTFRKPLVVFTPKSLLRRKEAVSSLADFTNGKFQEVIDDTISDPKKIKRIVLCTGKIFYELQQYRMENKIDEVALVRVEQLYPLLESKFKVILDKYPKATDWVWVQEEPRNMGAWTYVYTHFPLTSVKLRCIARKESASPATGFSFRHKNEQEEIIKRTFEK